MLTVCVSASDPDYATTGDVMALLFNSTTTAVVASTQEINHLGRLITRASRWADAVVGYPLALQAYSETRPSYGDRTLMLSRTPILKVLRFFDSTATSAATAICSSDFRVEDAEAGFLSRDAGWRWTADHFAAETCFNLGLTGAYRAESVDRPWLIEYVAGYKLVASTSTCHGLSTADETWTTGATLPDDIIQAVALRAAELYSNPLGVTSRRVGDLAVDYGSAGPGSTAAGLLAPYVRKL